MRWWRKRLRRRKSGAANTPIALAAVPNAWENLSRRFTRRQPGQGGRVLAVSGAGVGPVAGQQGVDHCASHFYRVYDRADQPRLDPAALLGHGIADFLGAFESAYWSPFSRYVDSWGTIDHEFIDPLLNRAHREVYEKALELGRTIAKNTVPIGATGHLRSVKPDYLPAGPTPDHIKAEAMEINSLVPSFTLAHERFVRLANRRLRGVVA